MELVNSGIISSFGMDRWGWGEGRDSPLIYPNTEVCIWQILRTKLEKVVDAIARVYGSSIEHTNRAILVSLHKL